MVLLPIATSLTFLKVFLYTIFALLCFALNSILCRIALRGEEIDAASFTGVRLVSGAVALIVISFLTAKGAKLSGREGVSRVGEDSAGSGKNTLPAGPISAFDGSWLSALYLFVYAICFSLAYVNLTAGTGALILFGSVQMSMMVVSLARGERPGVFECLGLVTAVGGLVYLVLPGLASPPLASSLLMAAAGAAWGMYTLRGRGSKNPLADTAGNFGRTLPFAAVAVLISIPNIHLSPRGIGLAIISGAVTSGIGYSVWYAALNHIKPIAAAVLQLTVPIVAAAIAITFLGESITPTLTIASILILGGVGITIFVRKRS